MFHTSRFLVFALASSLGLAALAQSTARVSLGSNGAQGDGDSGQPALSGDGRFVAFSSVARNWFGSTGVAQRDVYVRDRFTGRLELISARSTGASSRAGGSSPAISSDGRYVAFASPSNDIVPGYDAVCTNPSDPNDIHPCADVFVRDRATGTTRIITIGRGGPTPGGVPANGDSGEPAVSGDASVIVFASHADNFVGGDTNHFSDVFARELGSNVITRLSVGPSGEDGNRPSGDQGGFFDDRIAVSANGRFVAFTSWASNLVAGDTNAVSDVFVRDRTAGTTLRASSGNGGVEPNAASGWPAISGDGRFVAFQSSATNIGAPAFGGAWSNVFVRDLVAGTTECVSVGIGGASSDSFSGGAILSADGRFVAFSSEASNLVPNDTVSCLNLPRNCPDVFVHDRQTHATERISIDTFGNAANDQSGGLSMSRDGRFVAYSSAATNLVSGDTNGAVDVFARDRLDCGTGSVSQAAAVLSVNGSAGTGAGRLVTAATGSPITVALQTSPAGPSPASYDLWVWRREPENAFFVNVGGESIGCTENPTPLHPRTPPPQPFLCVLGGLAPSFCGAVHRFGASPPSAPWSLTRAAGFARPLSLTIQGVIQDAGASNAQGLSVTNAVVLRIQ